jgi:hypothetical protein
MSTNGAILYSGRVWSLSRSSRSCRMTCGKVLAIAERCRQTVDATRESFALREIIFWRIVGTPRRSQIYFPSLRSTEDELT